MAAHRIDANEKRAADTLPVARAPDSFRLVIFLCAAFIAGIGLLALLGWILKVPFLTTLGSGMIPVAPSTAALFVLYAVAVFFRARFPSQRVSYWAGLSLIAACALVALLLFILSYQGIHPDAEHLGFAVINAAGEIPKGHMSPLTALCFLLAALSFLTSLRLYPDRPLRAAVAWSLACLLIMISVVLVLAYLYGEPLLYGGRFIPPAALTSMAFMALGVALVGLAGQQARLFRRPTEPTTCSAYTFIMIFIILALGIITAGYLSYTRYETHYRTEVEHELSAIADLKADGLMQWRKERMGDGAVLYKNDNFSSLVRRSFAMPADAQTTRRLRGRLFRVQDASQYDAVFLLDAHGRVRLAVPDAQSPPSRHVSLHAAEAQRTGQVALLDFYRNEHDRRIYLAVLVPILDGEQGNRAIGTLVMRIDPWQRLYPFLQRWPIPSLTAETVLVRREGDEVLFLNELRLQKNTALRLRFPLDYKGLPAVQAVLGKKGITEDRDYRGAPVLADVRAVPDSPWFLVSRLDVSEISSPLKERLWMMVGFVVVLLFGSGAGVGLLWRQQNVRFYQERCRTAEVLRESEERYRSLFENMLDAYAYCRMVNDEGSPQDFVYLEVNPSFERLTGLKDVVGKKVSEVIPGIQDASPALLETYGRVALTGRPERFETYVGPLGIWFSVAVYSPMKEHFVAVFDNITERRQAEEKMKRYMAELRRSNEELGQFAYIASHDLQEPLRMISSYLQLIEHRYKDKLDEDANEFIAFAVDGANRLQSMINGLLSYSRVESRGRPFVNVDCETVLMQVLSNLTFAIEKSGASVAHGPLPTVLSDENQLIQVFQNLLENAVKFRGKEPLKVHISAERKEGEWVFSVKDNGIGIEDQYKERIFRMFQQLQGRRYPGVGIGLTICRRIIERHKGRIWVESETGKGSTFFFSIPEKRG
jgi:PAS domain S-box-containing protein